MSAPPYEPDGRLHFPGVRAPKALLSNEALRQLSARQLEVLDELEVHIAQQRLADLTMAEIASLLNCSLRTLYGIAPSKDELLLTGCATLGCTVVAWLNWQLRKPLFNAALVLVKLGGACWYPSTVW